jgi:hypothetical protein
MSAMDKVSHDALAAYVCSCQLKAYVRGLNCRVRNYTYVAEISKFKMMRANPGSKRGNMRTSVPNWINALAAGLWSEFGWRLVLKVVLEPVLTLSDGSFLVSIRRFFGLSHRCLRALPACVAQRAAAVGGGAAAAGGGCLQRAGLSGSGTRPIDGGAPLLAPWRPWPSPHPAPPTPPRRCWLAGKRGYFPSNSFNCSSAWARQWASLLNLSTLCQSAIAFSFSPRSLKASPRL